MPRRAHLILQGFALLHIGLCTPAACALLHMALGPELYNGLRKAVRFGFLPVVTEALDGIAEAASLAAADWPVRAFDGAMKKPCTHRVMRARPARINEKEVP